MDGILNIAETFEQIFAELKKEYGCTYMFYLYEYGEHKIAHSSHPAWYDLYFKENLIDHCPLLRLGHQNIDRNFDKETIVRWDSVNCLTKEESNVVGVRTEFKICHGISFGRSHGSFKEYLGLATDATNQCFPTLILMNKADINYYLQRLRSIANFQRSDNVVPLFRLDKS